MSLVIKDFYDAQTGTMTYVVSRDQSCIVIDPVWNYESGSSTLTDDQLQQIQGYLTEQNLSPQYIFETHVHADHITSSHQLKALYPQAKTAIHESISQVQSTFARVFRFDEFPADGRQFDLLFTDGQTIDCGSFHVEILHTPGHTPACSCLKIDSCVFSGDAIFMPDFGTGRCDFPGGDAIQLYASIQKLYQLPDETKIYVGHDYKPGGRNLKFQTTVAESKKHNIHLKADTSQNEFIEFRTGRDANLSAPKLLLPSLQININAGEPLTIDNEPTLKIPLKIKSNH